MKPTGHPRSTIAYAGLFALAIAAVTVDPNGHFLSENDIYMLRQIQALRELAPWRWSWNEPGLLLREFLFFNLNFWSYFHGPLPPLLQGVFLDLWEVAGGTPTASVHFLSTGVLHAAACVLAAAALRSAGFVPSAALLGGLAICASPAFLAMGRSFGGSWLVGIVFGQALALFAVLRAAAGAKGAGGLLAVALSNHLLSNVLSPFDLAALAVGLALAPAAQRGNVIRSLRSRWMLLPLAIALTIVALNGWVYWRGVTHPSQVVLFLYPFAQYLTPATEGLTFARWSWADRAQILALVFGLGLAAAIPIALAGFGKADATARAEGGIRIATAWAATAAGGFGLAFLFVTGPTTGSQAMPLIGYPLYILLPGVVLCVAGLAAVGRAGRPGLAAIAAALWLSGSALQAWVYVWRIELPSWGARLTVREGTDVAGFRVPDGGVETFAAWAFAALAATPSDAQIAAIAVTSPDNDQLRNVFFWRAGLIDGGYFERAGRCVRRAGIGRNGRILEAPETPAMGEMMDRLAGNCAAGTCLGVGVIGASETWRVETRRGGDAPLVIVGFGVPKPDSAAPAPIGRRLAPIGFMGAIKTGRVPQGVCAKAEIPATAASGQTPGAKP